MTRIQALVALGAARTQVLEDLAYSLILGRTMAYATSGTLDNVGRMVGQVRSETGPDASDDPAYRALILGRVSINTSHGEPEAVLTLMRSLQAEGVKMAERFPAGIHVEFGGSLLVGTSDLIRLLELTTAPVSLSVVQYTDDYFGFANDPEALGFGVGEIAKAVL